MAADTKGTAHFFGIGGTITNATIIGVSANKEFLLSETTENESGVTVETRKDNRVKRLSVTLRMRSGYTFPDVGATIAISGLADTDFNATYEIDSKGQTYANNAHLEQTLELVAHEGITYSL
jgi:hypothetical protein